MDPPILPTPLAPLPVAGAGEGPPVELPGTRTGGAAVEGDRTVTAAPS